MMTDYAGPQQPQNFQQEQSEYQRRHDGGAGQDDAEL